MVTGHKIDFLIHWLHLQFDRTIPKCPIPVGLGSWSMLASSQELHCYKFSQQLNNVSFIFPVRELGLLLINN